MQLCSDSAGYEHLFDFMHWIFGSSTGHSGIRMNIKHWQDNMTSNYQDVSKSRMPFFESASKGRAFVQTGVSSWSCSIPREASSPCCNLAVVGGDGTHIGVSAKQVMKMSSIWEPIVPREGYLKWGRSSRRPASFVVSGEQACLDADAACVGSNISKACKLAVSLLRNGHDKGSPSMTSENEECLKVLPREIFAELVRWCAGLTVASSQWRPLQQLLLSAVSSESVSGAFPVICISAMRDLLSLHVDVENKTRQVRHGLMVCFLKSSAHRFEAHAMPYHAWNLVQAQVTSFDSAGRMLNSTFDFLRFLGNVLGCGTCVFQLT